MTREEAKHLSDVLKAYSEGEVVQIYTCNGWKDVLENDNIKFCGVSTDYRIKPKPELHPYDNAEEFSKAMKEHGPMIKDSEFNVFLSVIMVNFERKFVVTNIWSIEFKALVNYTWQDGTPCGILIE